MLDYSAAFDTVDHSILLDILRISFGLSGAVLNWISSYLSGRTQVIHVDGSSSDTFILSFGVPQGGMLGPLFYIMYTADIIAIFEKHGFAVHLYADDSQVYIHFVLKEVKTILSATESCIQDVFDWSSSRRLKLQGAKTEFIIIDRAGLLSTGEDLSIQIEGVNIRTVTTVRDLGVLLDSRFNMRKHISNVSKACFYHLRRLRQIRSCLNEDSAKTVAVALVRSRIDYCNAILAGLPETTLQPLTRVLHTAARTVLKLSRKDHITPALQSLHWLPVKERIKFKLSCDAQHSQQPQPSYLTDMVTSC